MEFLPTYNNDSSHNVFKNDPVELKKLVNKVVRVHYNSECVEGTIYTIDPVSQMIALMVRDAKTGIVDMHIIFDKHIETIETIGGSDFSVNELFDKSVNELTAKEKSERCDKLKNWLHANMIPIMKEGDLLKLADVLTIHPPYQLENCISKNVIILEKIQNLIKTMNDS